MKNYLIITFLFCFGLQLQAEERMITTTDGVQLFVNIKGSGTPVLYIHGGPGSGSYWFEKFFGEFLEQHYTMIYLDQRGVGRSSGDHEADYSMDRMVLDFEEIRKGAEVPGNAVIISPGTGLGEAGLFWDGKAYHPFATEGGHAEFSPRNKFDADLWHFLHEKYGLVSWERIISGSGIYDIYQFLIQTKGIREPNWFKEQILHEDPAALISAGALEGNYPVCKETIDLFVRYLATEANQFALKTKATGGIFIGGGIVPKIIESIDKEIFNQNFIKSDRMEELLDLMPVKAILNEKTATYGAALYGAMLG